MIPWVGRHALALAFGAALSACAAHAAGFDCKAAKTHVETLICAHVGLSQMDSELKSMFDQIQGETSGLDGETGERIDPIGDDQRRWRETARDVCPDAACLRTVYGARLRELRKKWPEALR